MKYYHGAAWRETYFEGWYLKYKTKEGQALALIPALHIDNRGQRRASLQVITGRKTWWLEFPDTDFHASETQFQIRMGQTLFTEKGAWLNIDQNRLSLHGTLHNGTLTSLKSDIMGPFRFLPGMECSHGVISMAHTLEGTVTLNGEVMDFSGGTGYIETDRGRSFPSTYLWTQCTWQAAQPTSLMLAIAAIPLPIGHFTGCICAVVYDGKEYRLATYRGAQIEDWSDSKAAIRQGKFRLEANLLEGQGHPLRAPTNGNMDRTIHESLCATVRYRFWAGEKLLFEHTDHCASFEYAENTDEKRKCRP